MSTSRVQQSAGTPGEPRLGVDIGRVIIHGEGPDTSFIGGSEADALKVPAVRNAFEALGRLNTLFDGRVWLVSKCGPRIQARTRAWLSEHRFFERSGVAPEHLHFCQERPQKATICRKLGITCFIDDRIDVLEAMRGIVPHRLLFGARYAPALEIVPVENWLEAESAIVAVSLETRETDWPPAR